MKILIVGLGSIAKKHIKAITTINKKAEIYAFRHSRASSNIVGVTDIYAIKDIPSYNFDFFLVSNPTSKHFDVINALGKFNTPFFIEKPLFSEINNYHSILVDEITKSNLITYIACNLRFLDCLKEVKKIVGNYRINEVNSYCGSYLPDWRPEMDFRNSYSANKDLGGGVHIDLIHELDYVYWIFGTPIHSSSTFSRNSSLNITAVDYANYTWVYDGFCANIILNYYRKDSKRSLEIVCEKDTFYVDLLKNKIFQNGIEIYNSNQTFQDTYKDQMNYFMNKVVSNENTFNPINEGFKLLKLCLTD